MELLLVKTCCYREAKCYLVVMSRVEKILKIQPDRFVHFLTIFLHGTKMNSLQT